MRTERATASLRRLEPPPASGSVPLQPKARQPDDRRHCENDRNDYPGHISDADQHDHGNHVDEAGQSLHHIRMGVIAGIRSDRSFPNDSSGSPITSVNRTEDRTSAMVVINSHRQHRAERILCGHSQRANSAAHAGKWPANQKRGRER